ncbi:MAG TPA: DUF1566 domain-containing protein, partial [Burkholderiales bacterium]|nr:DUF1566 domain-containing protein [Burkholderiales bacterium]
PYYATPSWDQTLPANTRFIVLSNFNSEAVLDRETGLVWHRSPGIAKFLSEASAICKRSTTGNRFGWRLPTLNELASLFDPSATAAPGLPLGHPFTGLGALQEDFWSSTPTFSSGGSIQSFAGVSYETNPSTGVFQIVMNVFLPNSINVSARPWCVRGGLSAAEQ